MENFETVFQLNEQEKIVLSLDNVLALIDCCDKGFITFIDEQQQIILSGDMIRITMRLFVSRLKKALSNELLFHPSINEDIGLLYDRYNYLLWTGDSLTVDGFIEELVGKTPVWVGIRNYLWAYIECVTWLYNNKAGDIVLEVSPCYPYLYCEPDEEPNYVPYEEWIKNYKPSLIRTIPKEVAQKWLGQAEKIVAQIQANVERWENEAKKG